MNHHTQKSTRWVNEANNAKLVKFPNSQVQMPFSEEAEQAAIGAVITNPNALAIMDFLKAEDFFLLRHTYIWRAIEVLESDPQIGMDGIDYLTIAAELERRNFLDTVGGTGYLLQLVNNTPSSVNVEAYARIVQRYATRRRLLVTGEEIKALALDESLPLERVVDESNRALFESTDQRLGDENTALGDLITEYFAEFEEAMTNPQQMGLPTGYREFDTRFGGLHRGETCMVAAPEGNGKTTYCLNVVANAARLNQKCAVFSLEMSKEEIIRKFLSMETGITDERLKMRNDIKPHEWQRIVEALGRIAQWPVHIIDDMPGLTPLQFKRRYRKLELGGRIEMAFIDGLWLMEDDHGSETDDNANTKFNPIMKALAVDAKLNRKRILITHQYNRNSGQRSNKRPLLSDILGGGVRDAYLILALYRDFMAQVTDTEVITLKHRGSSKVGSSFTLAFDPLSNRYLDKTGGLS